jgi:hypothetical protein
MASLHAIGRIDPDASVTIFDIGKEPRPDPPLDQAEIERAPEFYADLYAEVKKNVGLRFPPIKTHFTEELGRYPVEGDPRLWRSELLGGLTNYWGATMLPFSARELAKWPVDLKTLSPYIKLLASAQSEVILLAVM